MLTYVQPDHNTKLNVNIVAIFLPRQQGTPSQISAGSGPDLLAEGQIWCRSGSESLAVWVGYSAVASLKYSELPHNLFLQPN